MTGGLTALKLPQPDFIDFGKGLLLILAAVGWAAIYDAARGASGCCGGKIEAEGHGPRHSGATTFGGRGWHRTPISAPNPRENR